ncbi:MAG: glycoside hydrolase family 30 beta sandwich domain-containing protein, partial [Ferruginibacter sp.]
NLLRAGVTAKNFGSTSNSLTNITVDSTQQFQAIDGFGYTFTEGSAHIISQLPALEKSRLLTELFGSDDNSIGVSYLRLGIGATDLSTAVYSYDDMPAGQEDPTLANFSIAKDMAELVPLLKQALLINPSIKLLATPWSPPVWMKDNSSSIGGSLKPQFYSAYANYFVKYIQAMQTQGLPIYAVTPQNEPLHPGNNPSMYMTATQQADFIKNNLGPAFAAAGIQTKIIIYDHNCDRPDYPLSVLGDGAARAFVDGSAFHLYAGNISVLTDVHNAYPDKNVYFTEQYTASSGNFSNDLVWHLKNVVIGSARNYSKVALEWNLANDPGFGPYTAGGCNTCLGALTVSNSGYTRNVGYYIIAQVSKFVPAGSKRIVSDNSGTLSSVAFLRADGKKVLLVLNEASSQQDFNIKFNNKWTATSLPGNSAATYVW